MQEQKVRPLARDKKKSVPFSVAALAVPNISDAMKAIEKAEQIAEQKAEEIVGLKKSKWPTKVKTMKMQSQGAPEPRNKVCSVCGSATCTVPDNPNNSDGAVWVYTTG